MSEHAVSDFKGKDGLLIQSIDSLLEMDAKGILVPHGIGGHARTLLRAAKAAIEQAARTVPEIITTAKMYHEVAQRLYALLDDIDTAGDIAKGDDALYRKIVERTQSKKGTFVISCDGQTVRLVDDAMLSAAQEQKK